jgi:hypothetical protein
VPQLAKETFEFFFVNEQGLYWKMTSELQPIPGIPASAGDDALSALIVFTCIDAELRLRQMDAQLSNECVKLRRVLHGHFDTDRTRDPLGWGLRWWKWQWTRSEHTKTALLLDAKSALSPIHAGLPFRLYGAMIGAKLSRQEHLVSFADAQVGNGYLSKLDEEETVETSDHFSIDKTMYAVALLPDAMKRCEWERL